MYLFVSLSLSLSHTHTHTHTHTHKHTLTHLYTQTHTFIFVLDDNVIICGQFSAVNTLHHQDQFIIGDVLIVDGDAADVVPQLNLDDELAAQVQ